MSRQEETFIRTEDSGQTKIYTVVPFITIDDLAILGMQAVAAEIKLGIDYQSPYSRAAREHLILARVTNRS